jgi:phosphoadenosine phosphosulfate reductase
MNETKIPHQVLINPILEWEDFHVWRYLIREKKSINWGYKIGLDRVGCLYFPLNSPWSNMIIQNVWNEDYKHWIDFLMEFAKDLKLKDPKEYVLSGAWKGRYGGRGFKEADSYEVKAEDCFMDETAANYYLGRSYENSKIVEIFKPFGDIEMLRYESSGGGAFDVKSNNSRFTVRFSGESGSVRVEFDSLKSKNQIKELVRKQIRKVKFCVGCRACVSICPNNAIMRVGEQYKIDQERCNHCLRCVRENKGCLAVDSIHV